MQYHKNVLLREQKEREVALHAIYPSFRLLSLFAYFIICVYFCETKVLNLRLLLISKRPHKRMSEMLNILLRNIYSIIAIWLELRILCKGNSVKH